MYIETRDSLLFEKRLQLYTFSFYWKASSKASERFLHVSITYIGLSILCLFWLALLEAIGKCSREDTVSKTRRTVTLVARVLVVRTSLRHTPSSLQLFQETIRFIQPRELQLLVLFTVLTKFDIRLRRDVRGRLCHAYRFLPVRNPIVGIPLIHRENFLVKCYQKVW